MNLPGTLKSLKLMLHTDWLRARNTFRRNPTRSMGSAFLILLLTIAFIMVEYFVSVELFKHIMAQVHLEALRYVLLAKLLQMVFLVFTVLLIYSNIVLSISSFFTSPEIDMIHPRPVSNAAIFLYRFTETILRSSWMFIAFGVPILFAYGVVMNPPTSFLFQIPLIILPSLILPAAIGVPIGILLILAFSPRRTQQVFLVMGLFLAVGLVLVFRLMQPEQLIDPIGVEQVNFYLDTLRIPSIGWLPTTWSSEGITAYGEHRMQLNQMYSIRLWLASGLAMFISYFIFRVFWWRARSGGRGTEVVDEETRAKTVTVQKPTPFRTSLIYRDLILFSRDPGQWSQLIVIAALVVIYVYNFKNLPYELYGFQNSMAMVSVAASGLIISALLARFGFPAVSTEGKAIWILRTGPINWHKYLWNKFLFLLVPASVIGLVLVIFSVRVLDVNLSIMVKCIVTELLIVCGCTALAVGLGAARPRFDIQEAAMVAVSSAGLWYMISAISFIGFTIFMVVLPDVLRFFSRATRLQLMLKNADRVIVWSIVLCVWSGVVFLPMNYGIRNLRKNQS